VYELGLTYHIPPLKKLDRDIFIGAFYKKAVDLINKAIESDEPFGTVAIEIEDACAGTDFEANYLEVISSRITKIYL